ncbi:MAG: VOC family protein [Phycisphaeraceae bacterium]|nr:VOC family protein [Phycisphaerales bacterium]MCB9861047.1 VOC family protein [Phycisphaeraceae bacterium]
MTEPQRQPPAPGSWCHIEIPAKDPAVLKKFYGDIFGCTFTDVPEMDYTLYHAGSNFGGGICKLPDGAQQGMINYIYVEDIPVTCEKIKAGGGDVVMPETPVGPVSWFAIVKDPSGNHFALWKSNPAAHGA